MKKIITKSVISPQECQKMKMEYVPPAVIVKRVILEGNIVAASPTVSVEVEDWILDDPNQVENSSDVWLNI